jgi:hypothetical protein
VYQDPVLVAIPIVVLVATIGLVLGAVYLAGGTDAIRRQARLLGILIIGLVVVLLATPALMGWSGGPAGLVLLGLSVAWLIARIVQSLREEGPTAKETWSRAFEVPGVRMFIAGWVGFLVVGTILLVLVASRR